MPNQRLPEKIRGSGTLYLWLRPGATAAKAARALRKSRRVFDVVECIEEEEELSWVREHGADFVQGFLLGRPSAEVRA